MQGLGLNPKPYALNLEYGLGPSSRLFKGFFGPSVQGVRV